MLGNWPGQMVYLKGEERRLNNCVWMVVNFCVLCNDWVCFSPVFLGVCVCV